MGTLAAEATSLTCTLHCLLMVQETLDLARTAGIQFVALLVSCAAFDDPPNFSKLYCFL